MDFNTFLALYHNIVEVETSVCVLHLFNYFTLWVEYFYYILFLRQADFSESFFYKRLSKWAVSERSSQASVTHLTAFMDPSPHQSPLTAV